MTVEKPGVKELDASLQRSLDLGENQLSEAVKTLEIFEDSLKTDKPSEDSSADEMNERAETLARLKADINEKREKLENIRDQINQQIEGQGSK